MKPIPRTTLPFIAAACIMAAGCSDSSESPHVLVPEADGGVPRSSVEPGDEAGLEALTTRAKAGDAQARFDLGVYYEREEGYEDAVFWYTLAVEKDVIEAHANLGRMYYEGLGVEPDAAKAAELFRVAADQGDPVSQYNLARLYEEGNGVDRDASEAIRLLQSSASQDNADAQNHLGAIYYNASSPDFDQAQQWYWRAAKQGHAHAQYNLGVMYYNGEGTPVDYQRAYVWILLGSRGGHALAMQSVDAVGAKLTEGQIEQATALADDWTSHLDELEP